MHNRLISMQSEWAVRGRPSIDRPRGVRPSSGAFDDKVGRHGMVTLGNRFDWHGCILLNMAIVAAAAVYMRTRLRRIIQPAMVGLDRAKRQRVAPAPANASDAVGVGLRGCQKAKT